MSELLFTSDLVEVESGLLVPQHCLDDIAAAKRPKAVDLFCGCGGLSLGLIQAGFEVVAACDNDTAATWTYLYNLGAYPCQFWWIEPGDEARMAKTLEKYGSSEGKGKVAQPFLSGGGWRKAQRGNIAPGVGHFFLGDICKLRGADILQAIGLERGQLDCVVGSPPCQGFSHAGKRNVLDFRNSLVFQFCRLVIELFPKTLVFENVPGILSMVTPEGIPVVDAMCRILEDGGFAGLDSLRRAMAAQTGRVGLIRGKGVKKEKKLVRQVQKARKDKSK